MNTLIAIEFDKANMCLIVLPLEEMTDDLLEYIFKTVQEQMVEKSHMLATSDTMLVIQHAVNYKLASLIDRHQIYKNTNNEWELSK